MIYIALDEKMYGIDNNGRHITTLNKNVHRIQLTSCKNTARNILRVFWYMSMKNHPKLL